MVVVAAARLLATFLSPEDLSAPGVRVPIHLGYVKTEMTQEQVQDAVLLDVNYHRANRQHLREHASSSFPGSGGSSGRDALPNAAGTRRRRRRKKRDSPVGSDPARGPPAVPLSIRNTRARSAGSGAMKQVVLPAAGCQAAREEATFTGAPTACPPQRRSSAMDTPARSGAPGAGVRPSGRGDTMWSSDWKGERTLGERRHTVRRARGATAPRGGVGSAGRSAPRAPAPRLLASACARPSRNRRQLRAVLPNTVTPLVSRSSRWTRPASRPSRSDTSPSRLGAPPGVGCAGSPAGLSSAISASSSYSTTSGAMAGAGSTDAAPDSSSTTVTFWPARSRTPPSRQRRPSRYTAPRSTSPPPGRHSARPELLTRPGSRGPPASAASSGALGPLRDSGGCEPSAPRVVGQTRALPDARLPRKGTAPGPRSEAQRLTRPLPPGHHRLRAPHAPVADVDVRPRSAGRPRGRPQRYTRILHPRRDLATAAGRCGLGRDCEYSARTFAHPRSASQPGGRRAPGQQLAVDHSRPPMVSIKTRHFRLSRLDIQGPRPVV
jgi:hypothetical protein